MGTVGRESGQVRLRLVHHTDQETLEAHVHTLTRLDSHLCTDEWHGYNHIIRPHSTVCHSQKEWARDDDGDGIREVHVNTVEGMWTDVRNFLRPFKGVHKRYLSGYAAMCEFRRNLKQISPDFISSIVNSHTFYTWAKSSWNSTILAQESDVENLSDLKKMDPLSLNKTPVFFEKTGV